MPRFLFGTSEEPQKHMLLYTVRGKGWLESGACRYLLEPGSCTTVPAGTENGFGIEEETWQIAWIFLSPDKQWDKVVSDEVSYTLSPAAEIVSSCIHTLLRSIALPIDLGGSDRQSQCGSNRVHD